MEKLFTLVLFLNLNGFLWSQEMNLNFIEKPNIEMKGDSVYYTLRSTKFYNYFQSRYDSTHILFFDEPNYYDQKAVIHKKDGIGSFIIKYKGKLLFYFSIVNYNVEGVGTKYYNYTKEIRCNGMFKKGKIHGTAFFFKQNGRIREVVLFKRGKYKKHLYHEAARNKKELKRGHNPFIPKRRSV